MKIRRSLVMKNRNYLLKSAAIPIPTLASPNTKDQSADFKVGSPPSYQTDSLLLAQCKWENWHDARLKERQDELKALHATELRTASFIKASLNLFMFKQKQNPQREDISKWQTRVRRKF
jgi:hypothetical protein